MACSLLDIRCGWIIADRNENVADRNETNLFPDEVFLCLTLGNSCLLYLLSLVLYPHSPPMDPQTAAS